ncbi:MAG: transcriptional regulator [Ahrensia sp.]|nr:transcriptional regulator [Ahrensia sp.]
MHRKYGGIVITGSQIRAARGLLNWSAVELAERVSMSRNTINRLETHDDIPPSRSQSLIEIRQCLEDAGVEFIEANKEGGPGVRLRQAP